LVADPSLARRVLGFQAQHDIGSMLRSALHFAELEPGRADSPLRARRAPAHEVVRGPAKRRRFGEAAVAAGYSQPEAIERALELQREGDGIGESHKLLGLILLEMGELSSEQLIDVLQRMQTTGNHD